MARSDKQAGRMQQIAQLLAGHPQGLSQTEIARKLQLEDSTVARTLPVMEEEGWLLTEEKGKLGWFGRSHQK